MRGARHTPLLFLLRNLTSNVSNYFRPNQGLHFPIASSIASCLYSSDWTDLQGSPSEAHMRWWSGAFFHLLLRILVSSSWMKSCGARFHQYFVLSIYMLYVRGSVLLDRGICLSFWGKREVTGKLAFFIRMLPGAQSAKGTGQAHFTQCAVHSFTTLTIHCNPNTAQQKQAQRLISLARVLAITPQPPTGAESKHHNSDTKTRQHCYSTKTTTRVPSIARLSSIKKPP